LSGGGPTLPSCQAGHRPSRSARVAQFVEDDQPAAALVLDSQALKTLRTVTVVALIGAPSSARVSS